MLKNNLPICSPLARRSASFPSHNARNLGIVDDHFFIATHDDQRQVCLCWSYGSRTYHDNQQQPQLHRCLHHPDLLRVNALDPDQAGKDPAA